MYQKVILIGRVGQKQLGYTKTQKPVAQYSLATTKSFKDKQTGDWNEHTEWHRLVSFNQCAEHVNNKLEPGDLIQVEGELRTRKWQDKGGQDRYTTEIVADQMQMLDSRGDGMNSGMGGGYSQADNSGYSAPSRPQAPQRAPASPSQPPSDLPDFDDDIPF